MLATLQSRSIKYAFLKWWLEEKEGSAGPERHDRHGPRPSQAAVALCRRGARGCANAFASDRATSHAVNSPLPVVSRGENAAHGGLEISMRMRT